MITGVSSLEDRQYTNAPEFSHSPFSPHPSLPHPSLPLPLHHRPHSQPQTPPYSQSQSHFQYHSRSYFMQPKLDFAPSHLTLPQQQLLQQQPPLLYQTPFFNDQSLTSSTESSSHLEQLQQLHIFQQLQSEAQQNQLWLLGKESYGSTLPLNMNQNSPVSSLPYPSPPHHYHSLLYSTTMAKELIDSPVRDTSPAMSKNEWFGKA